MAGNSNSFASRQPAARIGGRRRRLSRHTRIPRSNTAPFLNDESSSGVSSSGLEYSLGTDLQESVTVIESSQSMMNFYPPTGFPTDLRPATRHDDASSTSTSKSALGATNEGKKKHNLTLNNVFRSSAKQAPPQTPLPPMTPTKAAKLLGVTLETGVTEGSYAVQDDGSAFDSVNDASPRLRYGWPRQHSAPVLTTSDNTTMSRFHEEDITTDLPKSKRFWDNSKKTAQKLSESLTHFIASPKPPVPSHLMPSLIDLNPRCLEANFVNSIGVNEPHYSLQDFFEVPSHPAPAASSRRRGIKKGQKELDRMTPITETSQDDMNIAYRHGTDNTELDVISEYTQDDLPHTGTILPKRNESLAMMFTNPLELASDDAPPIGKYLQQASAAEKEKELNGHPGLPFDLSQIKRQEPMMVQLRSPLQIVENRLLDVAEMELEARKDSQVKEGGSPGEGDYSVHGTPIELSKAKQPLAAHVNEAVLAVENRFLDSAELKLEERRFAIAKLEASKLLLDTKVAALKESHEKMKKEFAAMKFCDTPAHNIEASDSSDDDDLVSIRSSIDLDEEPTIHTAVAMPFIRVTPGMVKLIDISPRKK